MKTLEEIVSGEQHFEKYEYAGIYFLIFKKEVIYVGSSLKVGTRLFAHRSDKRKKFSGFHIIKYDDIRQMRLDEIRYIQTLKPKYNFYYNPDSSNYRRILYSKYIKIKNVFNWVKEHNLSYDKVNAFFRDEKVEEEIIKNIEKALYPKGVPSRLIKFNHNKVFTIDEFLNNDQKYKKHY